MTLEGKALPVDLTASIIVRPATGHPLRSRMADSLVRPQRHAQHALSCGIAIWQRLTRTVRLHSTVTLWAATRAAALRISCWNRAARPHNSPLWNRNFEYQSPPPPRPRRRPHALPPGIRGEGVIATVKHFAFNQGARPPPRLVRTSTTRTLHSYLRVPPKAVEA